MSSQQANGVAQVEFVAGIGRELDRLAGLQPNWDGYGAPPIAPEIISAARELAAALPPSIAPQPTVVPMSTGNLQFEWHRGGRILEIEIEDPQTIHFLKWQPDDGIKEEDTFNIRDTDRAASLIRSRARLL